MPSILNFEERTLLTKRFLPAIHKEYVKLNRAISMLTDPVGEMDDVNVWLTDEQQKEFLRKIYRDAIKMRNKSNIFRNYVKDIFDRLGMTVPT